MMNNKLNLLSLGVLMVVVMGCTSTSSSDEVARYLLPADCANSCWGGIIPELTTKDDAFEILTDLYGVENVTTESFRDDDLYFSWFSNGTDWSRQGIVEIANDQVYDLYVWLPDDGLVVDEFVVTVGPPQAVGLVISGPEEKCAGAQLFYPQLGLEVFLRPENESVGVNGVQQIDGIRIVAPWLPETRNWYDIEIVPWNGYHEYCPEAWPWEEGSGLTPHKP